MRPESSPHSDCPKPPLSIPVPEGHNLGPSQVNARASTLAGRLPAGQGPPPTCLPLLGGLQLGWGPHGTESSVGVPTIHSFISSLHLQSVSFFLVTPLLAWPSSCILHSLVLWVS